MSKQDYTKESIKSRMHRTAASLLGVRNPDSLDPVVRLLVESLASEIFKLAGEMDDVENRIVDKLARTFIPSYMMSASPAHVVIHTRSLNGTTEINHRTEFAYKNPSFIQRYNLSKLVFTPVIYMQVIDADVAAVITGGKFYSADAINGKEHTANASVRSPLFANTMWIGLDIESANNLPQKLPLFFQLPFIENSHDHFKLLRHISLFHNDIRIPLTAGLSADNYSQEENLFGIFDPRRQMYNDIIDKYEAQFLTVYTRNLLGGKLEREFLPREVEHLFGNEITKANNRKLIWLKAVFPAAFDPDMFEQLSVNINCFPAANIFQTTVNSTISPMCSIIPLSKDEQEYFIGVDTVSDSRGRPFKQVRNHEEGNIAGTYMLRRGGSERFNSLNAKEYIERLVDIYRDETTAFAGFGRDIAATLDTLLSDLNELEVKLGSYDRNTEQVSYLVFSPDIAEKQNITVNYSLTNAAIANGIPPCEPMSVPEISELDPSPTALMTISRAGRKAPSQSSQSGMYQYLLTSRERIYTKEDIKQFCKCYFGDYFTDIEVKNGYQISGIPKQGIVRTTDIILRNLKIPGEEIALEVLKNDILTGLISRSPEERSYRVILK